MNLQTVVSGRNATVVIGFPDTGPSEHVRSAPDDSRFHEVRHDTEYQSCSTKTQIAP